MSILQRFRNMGEAVFPLEIIPSPEGEKPYFCTPAHADTFARLGVDGIHFCIVPHAGCSEDECPVMVVSPESEEYVYTIAKDITDFLNILVTIKSAGAIEAAAVRDRAGFPSYLDALTDCGEGWSVRRPEEVQQDIQETERAAALLRQTFGLIGLEEDPYQHIRRNMK